MEQQSDGRDGLHRLSKPHFIREDRAVPRVEKRDPIKLIGERVKGKINPATRDQSFERRLEQIKHSVLKLDDISWRSNPRHLALAGLPFGSIGEAIAFRRPLC